MTELSTEALSAIEKVRKLLALANNNPNENEAQAASAKAMSLLEAYNLDMAKIDQTTASTHSKRFDVKKKGGLYQWQRDLWEDVARLNFCVYFSIKGLKRGASYEHRVVGRTENVTTTEMLAEYLQQAIERMSQTWAKERGMNVFCRDAIAYREGMSDRICRRLKTAREEKLEEDARKKGQARPGTGFDLVLVDVLQHEDELNNDYLMGWEPGTTTQRRMERERNSQINAERQRKWAEENPHLAAKEDAERQARYEALKAKWAKEGEARRKKNIREGRDPDYVKPNYGRAKTAREQRADTDAYDAGWDKGADVGLDAQINNNEQGKLT